MASRLYTTGTFVRGEDLYNAFRRFGVIVVLVAALALYGCGGAGTDAGSDSAGDDPGAGHTASGTEQAVAEEIRGERVRAQGGSYTRVEPAELRRALADEDLTLVNTHIPYEGELPRTDLFVPFDEVGRSLDRLPGDKDAAVVVYCRTGPMSQEAAETLVSRGYTNVVDLGGGMAAWKRAGFPLLREKR